MNSFIFAFATILFIVITVVSSGILDCSFTIKTKSTKDLFFGEVRKRFNVEETETCVCEKITNSCKIINTNIISKNETNRIRKLKIKSKGKKNKNSSTDSERGDFLL